MGKGIDLARGLDLEGGGHGIHARLLDDLKDQLLIVFLKALQARGHSLEFPVSEVDDTGQDMLAFRVEGRTFYFELKKKS